MTELPTWEDWTASLPDQQREYAEWLLQAFTALGAEEPESWARSEVTENFPQLAGYIAMRTLWPNAINVWSLDGLNRLPAGARLLEQGADPDDLMKLARAAAYRATFEVLQRLTGEESDIDLDGSPLEGVGWTLMELRRGQPTGRRLVALDEAILALDPSGNEGRDLRE